MKTDVLIVEGMSCHHCVRTIENSLKGRGVDGKADLGAKTVKVTYDESAIALDDIRKIIIDDGYSVR